MTDELFNAANIIQIITIDDICNFFWGGVQTKMSWHGLLTSQYSR